MPSSLTISLRGDPDQHHGPYLSSMLQGVLMENIDPSFADVLHRTGAHPYSQYVLTEGNDIRWTVNALSEEAERMIIRPLKEHLLKDIYLEHREETLSVTDIQEESISYDELVQKYYFGTGSKFLTIQFLTPTAFKQAGKYCIFPTGRLIFQSLMMRYDAGSESTRIFSDELLEEFEQYTEITDYRLQSVRYSMEGVRIPSFIGRCTFRFHGPQQFANTAHMLAQFGKYSGIGIKTGMGMGAMTVIDDRDRSSKSSFRQKTAGREDGHERSSR